MKSTHQHKHMPVTSYHENDSLLLQFILSEFLLVYREINLLHSHFREVKSSTLKRRPIEQRQLALSRFISSLEMLSGASHNTMRLFSWGQADGLLHKLNTYAALFSRRSGLEAKEELLFYRAVNQSLLLSMQLHDLAITVASQPPSYYKDFLEEIEQLEEKVLYAIEKSSKRLPKIVQRFSNDENVIFFVLRHTKDFDELLHDGYTRSLLVKVGGGSLDNLEKSLIKKYSERGFSQLLPIISEKFEHLKNI